MEGVQAWHGRASSEVSVDPKGHVADQIVLFGVGEVKEFFREKETK